MLLITDIMFDGPRVWIYSALVVLVIVGLWFIRPLARKAELVGSTAAPPPPWCRQDVVASLRAQT